jgi:hypothetical protein
MSLIFKPRSGSIAVPRDVAARGVDIVPFFVACKGVCIKWGFFFVGDELVRWISVVFL